MTAFYRLQFGVWLVVALTYAIADGNWIAIICAPITVGFAVFGEVMERSHRRRTRAAP